MKQFIHFDHLARKHVLEPLKTNADEYIIVGNVLKDMESDHAIRVVRLAVDMIKSMNEFNDGLNPTSVRIDLKIGIHTSPVLCGVIRMKSFMFDVWEFQSQNK